MLCLCQSRVGGEGGVVQDPAHAAHRHVHGVRGAAHTVLKGGIVIVIIVYSI
jgi:hypothetical protein